MSASYHVKIHNLGRGARVIHDGARPIRIPAGEWVDAILAEETITRLKAERHDQDPSEEPVLEVQQGEKAEEIPPQPSPPPGPASQAEASGEENNQASHKKRAPHA